MKYPPQMTRPAPNDGLREKPDRTRGVVAVLQRDDKLMMIQRAYGIAAGGKWCFPGGAILPGESAADAVVREIREEVNLVVEAIAAVWEWSRDDGQLHLEWWTADIISGEVTPDPAEVRSIEWMTIDAIRNHPDVLANNITFLNHAQSTGILPTTRDTVP